MSETIRTFVALDLDPRLVEAVVRCQRQLESCLPAQSVRWSKRDQLHLTLAFLGDVPATSVEDLMNNLEAQCAGLKAPSLTLQHLGAFPSPEHPRVIWMGLAGDLANLEELHGKVVSACAAHSAHREERDFHPHLSLGRVTGSAGAVGAAFANVLSASPSEPLGSWRPKEVVLYQSELASQGARYTRLATWPLELAAP